MNGIIGESSRWIQRKSTCVAVVMIITCNIMVAQSTSDFVAAIESIKRSIFPLRYREPGETGTYGDIVGTGFFVGKEGYFITAGHVAVKIASEINDHRTAVVVIPNRGWADIVQDDFDVAALQFDITRVDQDNDIALCKTRLNPFEKRETKGVIRPASLRFDIPRDGTEVGYTGFPLSLGFPVSGRGIIAGSQRVMLRRSSGPPAPAILIDTPIFGGISGSPLYTQDGQVLGVVTSNDIGGATGLSGARPARFIKALLDTEHVAY